MPQPFKPQMPITLSKIKKKDSELNLELTKTIDVLEALGKQKMNQLLVGFALETNDEEANAVKKLKDKNADFISSI